MGGNIGSINYKRWHAGDNGWEHQSIGLFLSRAANGNQISRSWHHVIQRRCIIVAIYSSRVINATACKRANGATRCQWLPINWRAIYAITGVRGKRTFPIRVILFASAFCKTFARTVEIIRELFGQSKNFCTLVFRNFATLWRFLHAYLLYSAHFDLKKLAY